MNQEELNAVRLHVLERAIGALIVTHPDPAAFALAFSGVCAIQQLDQIQFAQSRDDVRSESASFAREFVALANDEVRRREMRTPPESHED